MPEAGKRVGRKGDRCDRDPPVHELRLPAQDLDRARRFYKGARGERGAWFRDSEGNLLGIGEPVV
ncbi:MAG: hypothetical protein QOF44_921 [Streptomyces sp.]|jgi:predicted enzyme related to lactoylglutathione lyase|nr:hypothetical protein [Streptomyces sp.]